MIAEKMLPVVLFLSVLASCGGDPVTKKAPGRSNATPASEENMKRLANRRIFFGHQSVGFNIIDGVRDYSGQQGNASFRVTESRDLSAEPGPGFFHAVIGTNGDPVGKVRDFDRIVRSNPGIDLAFMKFCYVDVDGSTDIEAVFTAYKIALAKLKKDFPSTTFVHLTVPLTSPETGVKAALKKILGRNVRGYGDDLAKERFNNLMRGEYEGREPFFDIAYFESTSADGARTDREIRGEKYYALRDEYTTDGGHLNQRGSRFIAVHLLDYLASIAR